MKFILPLLCSLFSSSLFGQITITKAIFYKAGDTIVQNIDNDGSPVVITNDSSGAFSWDFSGLQKQGVDRDSIRGVLPSDTNKLIFPTASIIMPFVNFGNEYVEVTNTEVRGLGLNFNFFGVNQSQLYTKGKRLIQFAPITYNTTKNSSSSIGFAISLKAIPFLDSILKQLVPVPGANLDSIRLSLVTDVSMHAGAFGKLKTPYETIDVLRIKQDNKTSTKIEAKANLGIIKFWVDISSFIPIPLPKDTQTVYHFYSDKAKDPILSVNVNKSGKPTRALFRANAAVPQDTTKPKDSVNVHIQKPNASADAFKIQSFDQSLTIEFPQEYVGEKMEIINELGKTIYTTSIVESNCKIELQHISPAILFVRLVKGDESLTKKVYLGYRE
ncbi:MAG: hypothetical protein KA797_04815 [Chitinophagales bacterium]|nr:hypothetical protein [Chitinophagales bacterium]